MKRPLADRHHDRDRDLEGTRESTPSAPNVSGPASLFLTVHGTTAELTRRRQRQGPSGPAPTVKVSKRAPRQIEGPRAPTRPGTPAGKRWRLSAGGWPLGQGGRQVPHPRRPGPTATESRRARRGPQATLRPFFNGRLSLPRARGPTSASGRHLGSQIPRGGATQGGRRRATREGRHLSVPRHRRLRQAPRLGKARRRRG